jgi:hypothetical protein
MSSWRVGPGGVLLALALGLGAAPAEAARTYHLFMDQSQLLAEGDVELETWIWAQGQIPNSEMPLTTVWLWMGPVVGISSHLELQLPLQIVGTPDNAVLYALSLVARYRIFTREDDTGFQPLIRMEYQQPLSQYSGPPELKILLVGDYGGPNAVQFTANIGVQIGLPFLQSSASELPGQNQKSVSVLGTAAVGISIPVATGLRIGAEFDGQTPLAGTTRPNVGQLFLGPSLSWTHGPIWVTFGNLFGLTRNSNRYLPKVLWGITF